MSRARIRRLADSGFALAGKLVVRAVRLAADQLRGEPEPDRPGTRPAPPRPAPPAPRAAPPDPAEEHVTVEATLVETVGPEREPGADIEIAEPWPGYDEMSAREIAQRVRDSDSAVAAAVRLYEGAHKERSTVLDAAERVLSG